MLSQPRRLRKGGFSGGLPCHRGRTSTKVGNLLAMLIPTSSTKASLLEMQGGAQQQRMTYHTTLPCNVASLSREHTAFRLWRLLTEVCGSSLQSRRCMVSNAPCEHNATELHLCPMGRARTPRREANIRPLSGCLAPKGAHTDTLRVCTCIGATVQNAGEV